MKTQDSAERKSAGQRGAGQGGAAQAQRSRFSLLKGAAAVVAWLVIWQVAAMSISNPWLLSTPIETVYAWAQLATIVDFWFAVGCSFARIAIGFVAAFICGVVLGYMAGKLEALRTFLKPAVLAVKSAPVVCIIALLLVAVGSSAATSIVVGLVVFPLFYHALLESSLSQKGDIDKVLGAFDVPFMRRALCVDLVAFASAIRTAMATATGLAWKSGVAAELIGLPGISIGEGVFLAKISLDSASIIAWTATVILLAWVSERLLVALTNGAIRLPTRWLDKLTRRALSADQSGESVSESKAYGFSPCSVTVEGAERTFQRTGSNLSETISYERIRVEPGGRLCVMAPSGAGKTTLLRMLAGIDTPDRGTVRLGTLDTGVREEGARSATELGEAETCVPAAVSLMLQDSTLVPWASAIGNAALVSRNAQEIALAEDMLKSVLGREDLNKPASSLSGGMRRRAELCRALAHASSIVILDEPFSGLDRETKERCIRLIEDYLNGRTLVVATHDESDAKALKAECLRL